MGFLSQILVCLDICLNKMNKKRDEKLLELYLKKVKKNPNHKLTEEQKEHVKSNDYTPFGDHTQKFLIDIT